MSIYSIKDLEQLSGIKAHTLRIWEQRYNFIKPKRTDTNIRYYNENDLKFVLNVSLLKENGIKISKICNMDFDEINKEVLKITEKKISFPDQVHSLIVTMIDLDEERFEKILSTNILQYGLERTMLNIIYPFLLKIGILWQTGSIHPGQEHFISNLIRQKIIVAIDGQSTPYSDYNKKYLLFLPEGELHEISLLFSCYYIKSQKNKVIYLGQSSPLSSVLQVSGIHDPDYIMTVLTTNPIEFKTEDYILKLSESFPDKKILLSGYQVIEACMDMPNNVIIFRKLHDMIDFVNEN